MGFMSRNYKRAWYRLLIVFSVLWVAFISVWAFIDNYEPLMSAENPTRLERLRGASVSPDVSQKQTRLEKIRGVAIEEEPAKKAPLGFTHIPKQESTGRRSKFSKYTTEKEPMTAEKLFYEIQQDRKEEAFKEVRTLLGVMVGGLIFMWGGTKTTEWIVAGLKSEDADNT